MKRIELSLNKEFRIVMRSSTATQMTNIKSEVKKQINSQEPLTSNLGIDIAAIVWMGKTDMVTPAHTNNWLVMPESFGLWQKYLQEIGNPEYIVVLKEDSYKQLIVEDIINMRTLLYGDNDDIKRNYGNLNHYYSDWSINDLRNYAQELKIKTGTSQSDK